MTPINDSQIIEVKSWCFLEEQAGINVHFFKTSAVTAGFHLADLCDSLSSQFALHLPGMMSPDAEYLGLQGRVVFPEPISSTLDSIVGRGPGTAIGDPLPKQTCGLIKWQASVAGPRGRGRTYVPFPSSAYNAPSSKPDGAYMSALADFAAFLTNDITVTGLSGNATLNKVLWNTGGVLEELVIQATPREKWATQRRRSDFGATNARPF